MTYDVSKHSGVSTEFVYRRLQGHIGEAQLAAYCAKVKGTYAKYHTKQWTNEKHTEWLTRNYLAVKMMMSATVLLTSNEYAANRNLQIVEPYLLYYACICSCRALIFTLPAKSWDTDKLEKITHQKVINIAVDTLSNVSPSFGSTASEILETAKGYRELFSYRFPALGLRHFRERFHSFRKIVEFCGTVGEIAQLHSECLESSIKKHVVGNFYMVGDIIQACFSYPLLDEDLWDWDDYYRVGYWARKDKGPSNLFDTATDGMVEDYFGAWAPHSRKRGQYDPDKNSELVFQFV